MTALQIKRSKRIRLNKINVDKRALDLDTILDVVKDKMERHAKERFKVEAAKASVNRGLAKGGKCLRVL